MRKRLVSPLLIVATLVLASPALAQTLSCNFYVSTTGSGSAPGTISDPTTIANAQILAEAAPNTSASRTICLESGTYTLSANWVMGSSDTNEVWVPLDGPGTVTLDGNSGAYYVEINGATGLAFYGFTFQNFPSTLDLYPVNLTSATIRWNTFNGCVNDCVYGTSDTSLLIDSNTFDGTMGTQATPGSAFDAAVQLQTGSASNTISHNLCENLHTGGCVEFNNGDSSPAQSDNIISYNESINVLTGAVSGSFGDAGAYYFYDASTNVGSGNQIIYNTDFSAGDPAGATACIYLDNNVSSTTVFGNICAQNDYTGNLPANYDIIVHGGQNNAITNNILEVASTTPFTNYYGAVWDGTLMMLYQSCSGCSSMTGNTWETNIVFAPAAWPSTAITTNEASSGITAPTYADNDYFGTGTITWGAYTDSSGLTLNPEFADPTTNNYAVGNSTLISDIGWTTLPTNQGPLAYGITITNPPPTPTPTATATPTATPTPAWTKVQAPAACTDPGITGQTSIAESYGSNVTAGNLLVYSWYCGGTTAAVSGVTDTRSASWNVSNAKTTSAGSNYLSQTGWAIAPTSGAETITISNSSTCDYPVLCVAEFSPPYAGGMIGVDGTPATAKGNNTTVASSGNITTVGSPDLLYGWISQWGTGRTFGVGSGFTLLSETASGGAGDNLTEYLNLASAGTNAATSTGTGSTDWIAQGVAFTDTIPTPTPTATPTATPTPAWTKVQAPAACAAPDTTGQTSIAESYGSSVTAGNLLVYSWYCGGTTAAISSVADTRSASWNVSNAKTTSAGSNYLSQTGWAIAPTSGAETITISNSSTCDYPVLCVAEFSPPYAGGMIGVDGTPATAKGNNTTVASSGNITTVGSPDLLYGWISQWGTGRTFGVGSGFTLLSETASGGAGDNLTEYLNLASAGTNAATSTGTGSTDWIAQGVAFTDTIPTPTPTATPTATPTPAWTKVQAPAACAAPDTTGQTSIAESYGSSVTAGNLLVYSWYCGGTTAAISSVADTRSASWNVSNAKTTSAGSNYLSQTGWAIAPTSGAETITISNSSTCDYPVLCVAEFSPPYAGGMIGVDGTPATAKGNNTTVASSGNITTVGSPDLLYGWISQWGTGRTFGVGSGFTLLSETASGGAGDNLTEYLNLASAGTNAATSTGTGSTDWIAQGVAFTDTIPTPTPTATPTATPTPAWTKVQAPAACTDPGITGQTSIAESYGSSVTAGNLLVYSWYCGGTTAAISSVADTRSASWNVSNAKTTSAGSNYLSQTGWAIAPTSGAETITISNSSTCDYPVLCVAEFSPPYAGGMIGVDGTPATAKGNNTTVASSGNITTVGSPDLLYGWISQWGTGRTFGVGSGFTLLSETASGGAGDNLTEYLNLASAGTNAATSTGTGSTDWIAQGVAFSDTTPTATPTATP